MEKNIKIFYHTYLINDYISVVTEQLTHIICSKLYDKCQKIYIGVVGDEISKKWITDIVKNYSKIELHYFDNGDEKDTLNLITPLGQSNDSILYIHTKGITHTNTDYICQQQWRRLLNYKNIIEWKKCLNDLNTYDCVGALYREDTWVGYHPHFSGNFWWANYDYILTLNPFYLDKNYTHHRMGAEFWIGSNINAKFKCSYNYDFQQEPSVKQFNINEYINKESTYD